MRQILCMLGLVGLLAGGPGCFVLDELDSGMEKMKEASPGARAKTEAKQAEAERETWDDARKRSGKDGKAIDLKAWWKSARTPSSGPRDPSASVEIVTCRIGGEKRFMTKVDCEVQGGRY